MEKAKGGNPNLSSTDDGLRKIGKPTSVPTLKSLGIPRDESSQWQRLAKIPAPVAEAGGGG
jgi:hypothetical protein